MAKKKLKKNQNIVFISRVDNLYISTNVDIINLQ